MKAILASLILLMPALSFAATPSDVENVTIPYATKNSVSCGALQICELEFQVGETVNDFSLRDTQNWSINPAVTEENAKKVHHLIIMPVSAGLTTPLTVTTDRRIYEVTLESNGHIQKSRKIAFSYQAPSDKINDISKLASFVKESSLELSIPSTEAVMTPIVTPVVQPQLQIEKPVPLAEKLAAPIPKTWSLKPEHRSLRDVIEDWATLAGEKGSSYEVVWESRDFPLSIKQKKVIHTGDFWEALRILGEAYRNSDAPFQIQPTAFQQIVIQPMDKAQR